MSVTIRRDFLPREDISSLVSQIQLEQKEEAVEVKEGSERNDMVEKILQGLLHMPEIQMNQERLLFVKKMLIGNLDLSDIFNFELIYDRQTIQDEQDSIDLYIDPSQLYDEFYEITQGRRTLEQLKSRVMQIEPLPEENDDDIDFF